MRADPPAELVELVERLRLATAAEVRGVCRRVRELAGNLPLFPSIWVDALAQARAITPFQAAEINAGHGEQLVVGPYVLIAPLMLLGYSRCYRAREAASRRSVHLLVATIPPAGRADCLSQVSTIVAAMAALDNRSFARVENAGDDGDRLWVAYQPTDARPVLDLVLQTGRLSGEAVLEIGRQLTAALTEIETAGIVHGDLSPSAIWLSTQGLIQLGRCGIRGILRPAEGFAHAELPPESYDYLAPERVTGAVPPTIASDLFACGCVWWHLLTGRAPFTGGTSLGKLRSVQAAKIVDVRRLAPDAPSALVGAIAACTQPDPRRRPESFKAVAAMLGPPTSAGRRAIDQALVGRGNSRPGLAKTARRAIHSKEVPAWIATIAGCATVVAAVSWPLWRPQPQPQIARSTSHSGEPRSFPEIDKLKQHDLSSKSKRPDFVEPAAFLEPAATTSAERSSGRNYRPNVDHEPPAPIPPPIVLAGGKLTTWNSADFALRAGQTVRGHLGERPMVAVPPSGIVVAAEDVRFENIDFVWRQSTDAAVDPERIALIDLRAALASFQGCTFQTVASERIGRPTAICWNGPRHSGPLPPAGHMQLSGCVLAGVAAGIECRLATPVSIKTANTLYLGPGPLLRLNRAPRIDEPTEIELVHSTLRNATALVGYHVESAPGGPTDELGTVGITTNDCALVPSRGGALVLFATPTVPTMLAKSFQWSGQGSLLSADASVGAWLIKGSNPTQAKEIEIPVDGLVSSEVEFAGPADAGSSASRVTRWLAPIRSIDPPGIPDGLPDVPRLPQMDQ